MVGKTVVTVLAHRVGQRVHLAVLVTVGVNGQFESGHGLVTVLVSKMRHCGCGVWQFLPGEQRLGSTVWVAVKHVVGGGLAAALRIFC